VLNVFVHSVPLENSGSHLNRSIAAQKGSSVLTWPATNSAQNIIFRACIQTGLYQPWRDRK
ncbi:MAG: hypothetical protein KDE47_10475, partial [Caldilineaceae bacterium]|nr:hypothetical protein [Caldilineaceae bacterium]